MRKSDILWLAVGGFVLYALVKRQKAGASLGMMDPGSAVSGSAQPVPVSAGVATVPTLQTDCDACDSTSAPGAIAVTPVPAGMKQNTGFTFDAFHPLAFSAAK